MNLLIKKQKIERKIEPVSSSFDDKTSNKSNAGVASTMKENANSPILPQILDISIVPPEKLNAYRNATIAFNRDGDGGKQAVAEIITIEDNVMIQIIQFLAESRNYDMTEYKRTFEVLMNVGKGYLHAIEDLREVYERKVELQLETMTMPELLSLHTKSIPKSQRHPIESTAAEEKTSAVDKLEYEQ